MKIQVVGPIAPTGYGIVASHLVRELRTQPDFQVGLLPIGPVDLSWFRSTTADAVDKAITYRQEHMRGVEPDVTLAVWHEWDHPPKDMKSNVGLGHYVAVPTFELDTIRGEAAECLHRCDDVVVSSEWCQHTLLKYGIQAHKVVFHGVDTDIFTTQWKDEQMMALKEFRVINIGKLELRKGHDLYIRLLAHMLAKGCDVKFYAMWDNIFFKPQLQSRMIDEWVYDACQKTGANQGNVHRALRLITPKGHPEQVAEVINLCHAGIYPYRAEGWNLPLLETLACGKTCLATACTGPLEYLDDFPNATGIAVAERVPAVDGIWFKGQGNWANPDWDDLVRSAERHYQQWQDGNPMQSAEMGVEAERYTWQKAGLNISNWLRSTLGS
jgi:glycosyltransferase involved in cell wall biosynthesis